MLLVWALYLAYTSVAMSSLLMQNVLSAEKSEQASSAKVCPACQKSPICHQKYEMFPGHTACMAKSTAAKPIEMTEAERRDIVNYHNKLRASVDPPATNMLKLTWDTEIEMLARRWADACQKKNDRFYHDALRFIPGRFSVGQNLAWGGFPNFTAATNAWFAEKDDYRPYFGNAMHSFPTDKQVGHYTQMVWASTSLIGCASTMCDKTMYYVCNYGPSGNVMPFTSPYMDGEKGSHCKERNEMGLCVCSNICENEATMNVSICMCNCPYPKSVHETCSYCKATAGFYCGTQVNFMESDCDKAYALAACPALCGICPCAEKSFKTTICSPGVRRYADGTIVGALLVAPLLGISMLLK